MLDRSQAMRPIEILMVEDNPADIALTREILRETKLYNHISTVTDGEQAIRFLSRQGQYAQAPVPDLILLDLNLPRKDGREVLAEIKEDPELKHIPVVILTTSRDDQDVLASYRLHANCFVSKPVDLEQFMRVVQSINEFWLMVVKLPSAAAAEAA